MGNYTLRINFETFNKQNLKKKGDEKKSTGFLSNQRHLTDD